MIYVWLVPCLILGFSSSRENERQANQTHVGRHQSQVESRIITLDEARVALNSLVENNFFLSEDPFLASLKARIKEENEKESLLQVAASTKYKAHSLGYWSCKNVSNDFSYTARSANQIELFTIRGHFFWLKTGGLPRSVRHLERDSSISLANENMKDFNQE